MMRRSVNLSASFLLCLSAVLIALNKLKAPLIGIDDANIYFVYARNLANGYGFVYNIGGERVEGFTSLLWTLIAALAFKLAGRPEIPLLIVNISLISLGIAYALEYIQYGSAGEGGTPRSRLLWSVFFLAVIFTSPRYIVWNTITLMENALWSTLLLVTCIFVIRDHKSDRAAQAGFLFLSILLLLARPESLLWVALFLAVLLFRLAFSRGVVQAVKALAPSAAGILLVLILLTAFRIWYFGYPLPNTYYAKVSPSFSYNLEQGALYLVRYVISDPVAAIGVLAIVLACIHSILRPSPASGRFYLPFIAAAGLLAPLLTGGDHFGSFRFYQNVFPITALCLVYFLRDILPEMAGNGIWPAKPSPSAFVRPALAVLLLLVLGISQGRAWSGFQPEIRAEFDIARYERINGDFIQSLFSSLPHLPSVGVIAAGGIKYTYGGEIVDLAGLNNTLIAHNHGSRVGVQGHAAFEADSFYQLQPEIVLPFMVNEGWQYSEKELKDRWENKLAFKGLFDEPGFLDRYQYAKVCKVSPAGCKLALVGWFKKDRLESLTNQAGFSVQRFEYHP